MPTARLTYKTNPIYSKYVPDYKGRYLFYFGGGGSGKSVDMYYRIVKRILTEHDGNHKILVLRKVATSISKSIWDGIIKIIKGFGLWSMFKVNKVERTLEYKVNGNVIFMMGLDNEEKIKSLEGVTSIYVEEVTEFSESEWLQLIIRLRGHSVYPKQLVAAFNPIDAEHWVAKYVEPQLKGEAHMPSNIFDLKYLDKNVWEFKQEVKYIDFYDIEQTEIITTRVINTTYKHNRFLDGGYIASLNLMSSLSSSHYDVYTLGRWGQIIDGNAFIHKYSEAKHVKSNVKVNDKLPLHYSVDFNVEPYMSGLVFQLEYIENGFWNGYENYYQLSVIDEMAMTHPRNDSRSLGEELGNRFDLSNGVFLYGDASGNHRNGTRDVKTLFMDLKEGLDAIPIERIPKSNPKYANIAKGSLGRANFINLLFSGLIPVRIKIHEDCKELRKDLKYCVQGSNGEMNKKKRDGHHLDAFTYFVCHPTTLGFLAKKR